MTRPHFSTPIVLGWLLGTSLTAAPVLLVCPAGSAQSAQAAPAFGDVSAPLSVGSAVPIPVKSGDTPVNPSDFSKFKLSFTSDQPAVLSVEANSGILTGVASGRATITMKYDLGNNMSGKVTSNAIVVVPRVRLVLPTGILTADGNATAEAYILDSAMPEHRAGASDHITFTSTDTKVVTITPLDGRMRGIAAGDADITVSLVPGNNLPTVTSAPASISVRTPTGSSTLGTSLQLLDDSTVGELFGAATANGFYVVRLNLNNKSADTMLVYGDTLAVKVSMEKKYVGGKARSADILPARGWTMVQEADYSSTFPEEQIRTVPTADLSEINIFPAQMTMSPNDHRSFGAFDRQRRPYPHLHWKSMKPEVADIDPDTGVVTANTSGVAPIEVIGDNGKPVFGDNGKPVSASVLVLLPTEMQPHLFPYYPYQFQVVTASSFIRFDRIRQTDPFNLASGVATVVSFFTASNVLRGETATTVLDKFTNLLLPGLQRLFPRHIDAESANITNLVMKQVEEVTPNSTLSRLVLFPKRQLAGILRGYYTRISAIQLTGATVDVARVSNRQNVPASDSADGAVSSHR